MKVHHVGYLVKNIDKSRNAFCILGFSEISEICYDSYRDVNILFMRNGNETIELVSPASDHSPIAPLMKHYRNSPYHICYETDDIVKDTILLQNAGYILFDPPKPAPAIDNRTVCFFQNANTGITELLEA